MLLGGGIDVPLDSRWGMGFGLNVLLFPSVSETPLTSGSQTEKAFGMDFEFKGRYRLTEAIDIDARAVFQSFSAEFSGQGTRPTRMASSSQSTRGIYAGMSYVF